MKIFVNAVSEEGEAIILLRNKFWQLIETEIKEGVLIAQPIKSTLKDEECEIKLNNLKKLPFFLCRQQRFFVNEKLQDWQEIVSEVIKVYEKLIAICH